VSERIATHWQGNENLYANEKKGLKSWCVDYNCEDCATPEGTIENTYELTHLMVFKFRLLAHLPLGSASL
jgi:hypothetical protein